jgi:crotonobetainyl-CoA:carnitine CoA-transferase CaiB-like acyl-CoA transferase
VTKPFAGIRVLEVAAWTFVPAAGGALADMGADVLKVEPPDGDPQRGLMNLLGRGDDGDGDGDGAVVNPFVEIPNRGKRSITLDLASAGGRAVLLDLAATADVFLTSYLPAVRTKLSIDVDDIRAVNDRIVYVRGSGWGVRGDMAETGGFDLAAAWATSSMAYKMTRPGFEPMFQPAAFFDLIGANTIAGAIGSALFHRERTGEATEVDVSLMNVGMWALSPDVVAGPYVGSIPATDRLTAPNPLVNSYPTSDDRWLYLVCLQADRHWLELCALLERPDLAADERFADLPTRGANAGACVAELEATFRRRTLGEWRKVLERFTGVWAPVLAPAELHEHPQADANGYLPHNTTAGGAGYRLPAPPQQFGGEPLSPQGPAPELGQHTEELLLELGRDWDEIAALRESGVLG